MIEKTTKVLDSFGPRAMARGAMAVLCVAVWLTSVSLLRAGTGTVDMPTGWYVAGTNITANAIPEQFSKFDGWSGDTGGASISNQQITVSVTNAMLVAASFSERLTSSNAVPHRWLAAQNLSWTNDFESAVTNDHDKDRFTTGEEYWCGTDPTNSKSLLRIDEVKILSSNVRLVWSHAKVDTNIPPIPLQGRESLSTGEWVNILINQPQNGTNVWNGPAVGRGFYRLCVTNMP